MPYEIFVSHSSKDKKVADAIVAVLEQNNVYCWIAPRDIPPGFSWPGAITRALKEVQIMVLVLSSSANESPQIVKEVQIALNNNVIIIPFKIENCRLTDDLEYQLSTTHWIDAVNQEEIEAIHKLAQKLKIGLQKDILEPKSVKSRGTTHSDANNTPKMEAKPEVLIHKDINENETSTSDNTLLAREVEIGSYIYYGKYKRQPILWRVIDKNVNGIMLFSEKILCLKSFGTSNQPENIKDNNSYTYGSNLWGISALRKWLNTSKSLHYDNGLPDKNNVWHGINAYEKEVGFLTEFSDLEIKHICEVRLNSVSGEIVEGYQFTHSPDSISIDNAKLKFIQSRDKVFLLSLNELKVNVIDRKWCCQTNPTNDAVKNSEYQSKYLASDRHWWYWLRDALPGTTHANQCISETQRIGIYSAYYGNIGVRPAFYIQADTKIATGVGTSDSPYEI